MKIQRWLIALTAVNSAVLTFLVIQGTPVTAQTSGTSDVVPVLRGRALEIVDDRGRVRASITVFPPTTVDSKHYPETVLFRLADPKSGPVVKIDASENGSGLRFSDDSEHGGAVLSAKKGEGAVLQLTDPSGRQQTVRP